VDAEVTLEGGFSVQDTESEIDLGVEAGAGIKAYGSVQVEIGALSGLPVIGDLMSNEWGFQVPIVGTPTFEFDFLSFPIGMTFDYDAFKQECADLIGEDPDNLNGTVDVLGVPITFDNVLEMISVTVGASARAYAETTLEASLDVYFYEVTDETGLPTFSEFVMSGDWSTPLDMSESRYTTSDTGTVGLTEDDILSMTTGSPVWFTTFLKVTETTDVLLFDALFDPEDAGEGLLSVYLNDELIALIDEVAVGGEPESYFFALSEPLDPGIYTLSFRMDPYGEDPASVSVSNVATMYVAIPEPSTLLLLAPALVSFAALLRRKFRSVEV
jgi:hypothetical protein